MRKFITIIAVFAVVISAKAQNLLTENFDYSTVDLRTNGWFVHSGTRDSIGTVAGLSFNGYSGSGIGNAAAMLGASFDYNKSFPTFTGNGNSVYFSFMLNVTDTAFRTTGGYFFLLGNSRSSSNFTAFAPKVWAKDTAGFVVFGASSSSTAVYGTTLYEKNKTYLVIGKYTVNTGTVADPLSLWIKEAGVPATEAAAGTPDLNITTQSAPTGNDTLNAVGLRQATGTPDLIIDGISIGTTWDASVLPVSLKSFTASLVDYQPVLNWKTANETNFSHFAVEKSTDAKSFYEIAKVDAKHNNSGGNYEYVDFNKSLSQQYYRLKMVDVDGKFAHSAIVAVSGKEALRVSAYPNPVTSTLLLAHPKATAGASIRVVSALGKVVAHLPVATGATQTSMNVSKLVKASYLVVFDNNGSKQTTQLIKQ